MPALLRSLSLSAVALVWNADGAVRMWLIDIPLLQQALRNATTDCLTPAQRETYLLETPSDARTRYA